MGQNILTYRCAMMISRAASAFAKKCTLLCCLLLISKGACYSQTLSFSQSVSNINPAAEIPFNYIFDIACNSTTGDCHNISITGTLPGPLDFLSFSSPLPSGVASASYDPWTRQYTISFNGGSGGTGLAQGSSVQINLQVMFAFAGRTGAVANNTATASSSNAGTVVSSASSTISSGWSPTNFNNAKGGQNEKLPGGYQYWGISVGNGGFNIIDNYQIIDVIPTDVTLDQIRTPELPFVNHPGQLYYMRSDNPGVWHLWINFNLSSRLVRYVSGLGLPAGVSVSQVRLDLGTVPGNMIFNNLRYQDGFRNNLILYANIPNSLPDGHTYTNCADYTGTVSGSPISAQSCHTATINYALAIDEIRGYVSFHDLNENYITFANIGDTIKLKYDYYKEEYMTEDIRGGVMTLVLPPNMSFIPGSHSEAWTCGAFMGQSPVFETGTTFDGRNFTRVIYDSSFGNDFTIPANGSWEGCAFYFDVVLNPGISEGVAVAEYFFNATGSTHASCNTADVNNFLNGFASDYCWDNEFFTVVRPPGSAGIQSKIEVLGTLDAAYSQYPAVGTTVPGGLSNYRIVLRNPNATPIDNIKLIDIFPYVGDTEILDISTPRSSQWRPNLAQAITPPPGVAVQYTTVTNPCRDELAGGNPTPFPSGCNVPAWTSVAPTNITSVTALRFDLFGVSLNQSDSIVLEWEMRAPVNAPTGGEVAWNSFAYVANNATNGSTLLPAEPIKVGIQTQEGTLPIVGDLVWDDLNGNGLQDGGEPGIDGVRIGLYEDTNGNGIAEPGAGDNEYTWTISANGGQYIFSDFPTGNYFLAISDIPSGYVPTHPLVGNNNVIDSEEPVTPVISFDSTTDLRSIDFGLFNGTLPSLWSCSSSLIPNNDFELGLASWTNWGNASITNDAYQGSNAVLVNGGAGGIGINIPGVLPGQTYKVSFYAKNTGPEGASGGLIYYDANWNEIGRQARQVFFNTYNFHVATMTAPPNTAHIAIYGAKDAGGGAAYFDAFCVELVGDICDGQVVCGLTTINNSWTSMALSRSQSNVNNSGVNLSANITGETSRLNLIQGGTFNGITGLDLRTDGFLAAGVNITYNFNIPVDQVSFEIGHINYAGSSGDRLIITAIDGIGNPVIIYAQANDYDNDGLLSFSISGNSTSSLTIDATNDITTIDNATISLFDIDGISSISIQWDDCSFCPSGFHGINIGDMSFCVSNPSLGIQDHDGDGVLRPCDIDDDNDGIKDTDESSCNGNIQPLLWWSHNTPSNTTSAEIFQPTVVASAAPIQFGTGLSAFIENALIKIPGINQPNLASAMAASDYLQYTFTTHVNINAVYLKQFAQTKHGYDSNAGSNNYGYDFSILVSDDGFTSYKLIMDQTTIDQTIDPQWEGSFQEADDNFFYLRPSTAYTFRVYLYNKTTHPDSSSWFDDFTISAELCNGLLDSDGDGIVNSLDLDSDNDGIYDLVEAGHYALDANLDGIIDSADLFSGINGLYDALEPIPDLGVINYMIRDSEASPDGIYDPYELDADGDGCFDVAEVEFPDPDQDGIVGNGIPVVDAWGRVTTHAYSTPVNNYWIDFMFNFCAACRTAIMNPHIGFFRRN